MPTELIVLLCTLGKANEDCSIFVSLLLLLLLFGKYYLHNAMELCKQTTGIMSLQLICIISDCAHMLQCALKCAQYGIKWVSKMIKYAHMCF